MTNNDILRRIRYVFDLKDSKMIAIFALADLTVSREQVSNWLKKDDDADYASCSDTQMATFLNGFITEKRGAKDGPKAAIETKLTNNIIFRKLKIALNLQNEDVLDVMQLAGLKISKHELSALFRRIDHKHYRVCKDQILRNFIHGLQIKYRPSSSTDNPAEDDFSMDDSSKDDSPTVEPVPEKIPQEKTKRSPKSTEKKSGFDWNDRK